MTNRMILTYKLDLAAPLWLPETVFSCHNRRSS